VDAPDVAALVCYGIVAVTSIAFGAVYLVRSSYMPYHRDATEREWQELDAGLQALLLGLMRVAGGGLVAGGVALGMLLAFPFRDAEAWSRWALLLVGLAATLPSLYATASIRRRTGAHTPVWVSVAGVLLVVAGAILTAI
jgi:hypothetical protein